MRLCRTIHAISQVVLDDQQRNNRQTTDKQHNNRSNQMEWTIAGNLLAYDATEFTDAVIERDPTTNAITKISMPNADGDGMLPCIVVDPDNIHGMLGMLVNPRQHILRDCGFMCSSSPHYSDHPHLKDSPYDDACFFTVHYPNLYERYLKTPHAVYIIRAGYYHAAMSYPRKYGQHLTAKSINDLTRRLAQED